jgi:hypothetical protein
MADDYDEKIPCQQLPPGINHVFFVIDYIAFFYQREPVMFFLAALLCRSTTHVSLGLAGYGSSFFFEYIFSVSELELGDEPGWGR